MVNKSIIVTNKREHYQEKSGPEFLIFCQYKVQTLNFSASCVDAWSSNSSPSSTSSNQFLTSEATEPNRFHWSFNVH